MTGIPMGGHAPVQTEALAEIVDLDTELAVEVFVLEPLPKREVSANGNRADGG